MKKGLLVIVFLLEAASTITAFGLSVFTGGGYGIGLDGDTFGTKINITGGGTYEDYQNRFAKSGGGPRAIGGLDLDLGERFSVEFAGGYVQNDPSQRLWSMTSTVSGFAQGAADLTGSFIPLYLTLKGKVPVGRVSFVFGAGPSTFLLGRSTVKDERITSMTENWTIFNTYSPAWGYHGLVGMELRLAKWFILRLEVRGEQFTFRPKTSTIEAYTINYRDHLNDVYPTIHDQQTVFVEDLADYLNHSIDPAKPAQALVTNLSADNVAFWFGVVWKLF